MVPSASSPRRTRGVETPMAGISSRAGGDGGRRRHDPTGKLMTSVVRVGPAAVGVIAPATADRLAAGAARDTRSADRPAAQPAAPATTTVSTTTPRRTFAPLVMASRTALPGRPPLLDHEAGGRGQAAPDEQAAG